MRLYHRPYSHLMPYINRCYFDADHSRISLALARLRDLGDEFPDDPHIVYAEGLLRWEHLGQGMAARVLFERAYTLTLRGNDPGDTRWYAACNAASLSPNELEFRRWSERALSAAPKHHTDHEAFARLQSRLDEGIPYWQLLAKGSQEHYEAQQFGRSAGLMEIALLTGAMGSDEEVQARLFRGQSLRALYGIAAHYRETIYENFPLDERIVIHEAVQEIEQAVALDEEDPTLWNYRSAWLCFAGRYEEALVCADRAISLRPYHYPRPYINKALAFSHLGDFQRALECLREAERQAQSDEYIADREQIRQMTAMCSAPAHNPTLEKMEPVIFHISNAATVTSDQEIGSASGGIEGYTELVLLRARAVRGMGTRAYVPILAEMLTDFTPETVFYAVLKCSQHSQEAHDHYQHAGLYLMAHSEGVLRRDAARYMILSMFGGVKAPAIRRIYRQAILETVAAASDEMALLDTIMREELARIHPLFPELIADQEPVDASGRARAAHNILSRFTG